ncbi:MAG: PH domain-containing protein [Nitrososphaerota archaeon]|nr:PH domain-containing protein [Nitrososphaerota archaeon]
MEQAPSDLEKILGPNEQILMHIKQKIYHPKINIDSVTITNQRIILRHPHTLGMRRDYTDYNYQDISNVLLENGLMRSTIKCALRFGGDPLALNDLPHSEAQKAYGIIRENLVRFQTPYAAVAPGVPPFAQAPPNAVSSVKCRACGASVPSNQKFCGACGAPLGKG